jgi:hypothetical protein
VEVVRRIRHSFVKIFLCVRYITLETPGPCVNERLYCLEVHLYFIDLLRDFLVEALCLLVDT